MEGQAGPERGIRKEVMNKLFNQLANTLYLENPALAPKLLAEKRVGSGRKFERRKFGDIILLARKARGLSQTELGKLVGHGQSYIYRVECEMKPWSRELVKLFSTALYAEIEVISTTTEISFRISLN